MTETTEQVADKAIAALEDCLRLIDDMSRFIGQMSLRDYALFNDAPISGGQAIAALIDLRDRSALVRRLAYKQRDAS